jgi:hypothetical protein
VNFGLTREQELIATVRGFVERENHPHETLV